MQENIVLKINAFYLYESILSMATHYATLKNEGVRTKIHISQQKLILEY